MGIANEKFDVAVSYCVEDGFGWLAQDIRNFLHGQKIKVFHFPSRSKDLIGITESGKDFYSIFRNQTSIVVVIYTNNYDKRGGLLEIERKAIKDRLDNEDKNFLVWIVVDPALENPDYINDETGVIYAKLQNEGVYGIIEATKARRNDYNRAKANSQVSKTSNVVNPLLPVFQRRGGIYLDSEW